MSPWANWNAGTGLKWKYSSRLEYDLNNYVYPYIPKIRNELFGITLKWILKARAQKQSEQSSHFFKITENHHYLYQKYMSKRFQISSKMFQGHPRHALLWKRSKNSWFEPQNDWWNKENSRFWPDFASRSSDSTWLSQKIHVSKVRKLKNRKFNTSA